MICWMFPGQPVVFSDMSADDAEFLEIASLCQEITGYNPLERAVTASEFSESIRLQLFGVCWSLHRLKQLTGEGNRPNLIAEHSMGIYPALVAAGSIDAATALALTWRIGTCMAEFGNVREYALGCVIGLTSERLEMITANNGIHIANYNTSRHFLLAGERFKVEASLAEAAAVGAFSTSIFDCVAPLHTRLITEITGELQRIVAEYNFQEPVIPLIEHISQSTLTAATIPAFLVEELCRPVFWEATYRALRTGGVTRFQELGVGLSLTKFNRWIDSES